MRSLPKHKTVFRCQECGYSAPKWLGQCPDCSQWNSLKEEKKPAFSNTIRRLTPFSSEVLPFSSIQSDQTKRIPTKISEFDRILGGGVVPGSMILLGGPPGIGKSTLILEVASRLSENKGAPVLYATGEESPAQVRDRADRIGIPFDRLKDSLLLLSETNLENIIEHVKRIKPFCLILDSIQAVFLPTLEGAPGTVSQVRECASELMHLAKGEGITVFILGHVTKEGDIAGPRVLEHLVDTVLYFEAERQYTYRLLRAFKNRFGPTNELGMFEMTSKGLREVLHPSALFLNQRSETPGTAVTCLMEGTRPLLVEIQALVSRTLFGMPRRQFSGVDYNRTAVLLAVLEKRCELPLQSHDVYVSVAGGLKVKEPEADLATVMAIASAYRDLTLDEKTIYIGEVGLGGEIRPVGNDAARILEARKLGFKHVVIAKSASPQQRDSSPSNIHIIEVQNLRDAMATLHKRHQVIQQR